MSVMGKGDVSILDINHPCHFGLNINCVIDRTVAPPLLSVFIFAALTLSSCDFDSLRSGSRSSMASQARSCLNAGALVYTTW